MNKKNPWIELTKPRISFMQLVSVSIGYFCHARFQSFTFDYWYLLLGTLLASSSAAILNHVCEINEDRLMERTKNRPLVIGLIQPRSAVLLSVVLFLLSFFILYWVSYWTCFLSLMTIFLYVAIYTPLKKVTWLNTFVGAIPGALPILGGWFAYNHQFSLEVLYLMLVMFLWQFPHFFVLSFLYETDYKRAGFKMLSGEVDSVRKIKQQTSLYLALMIFSLFFPIFTQKYGALYSVSMLIFSIILCLGLAEFLKKYDKPSAKRFFLLTVLFLPLWFIFLSLDQLISKFFDYY